MAGGGIQRVHLAVLAAHVDGAVRYRGAGGATTHTLVMRARSGTVRNIYSEHALWKVGSYSSVAY